MEAELKEMLEQIIGNQVMIMKDLHILKTGSGAFVETTTDPVRNEKFEFDLFDHLCINHHTNGGDKMPPPKLKEAIAYNYKTYQDKINEI
jgi:hypothetical protein